MRKRMFAGLTALTTIVALAAPTVAVASEARSNLDRTRRQIRSTRARLRGALQNDAAIQAALRAITAKLYSAQNDLAAARGTLHGLDLAISTSQRRFSSIGMQATRRQRVINERAAALYIMGPSGGVNALSSATSVGDYVARAGALDFIGTFDRTMLEDLASLRHEQVLAARDLKTKRSRAASVASDVAARVQVVAEAAAVQREAHAAAARRVAGYKQELSDQIAQEATIAALIRKRSGSYQASGGSGTNSGASSISGGESGRGFAWPTINHHINSPYGPRNGGFHTGMDLECSTGDPIAASKGGRIIEVQHSGSGYGNMIIIDHGGSYSSLYAHMSQTYARDGDTVKEREVIGACGETGNATGSHLHFEIRINGNHTNPRPYMP